MRVLSAALLAVVACAHVERHPTDVERRLAALEARTDWRAVPQEEFYRSLRVPSGIFYASAPMSRINPPSFLLGQGAAVGEGGNCAEPSAACRAASFTATGNSTAAAFIPTGSTIPTNGMYLAAANQVGIGINGANACTFKTGGVICTNGTATLDIGTGSGGRITLNGLGATGIPLILGNSTGDRGQIQNARGAAGSTATDGPFQLVHTNGSLDATDEFFGLYDNSGATLVARFTANGNLALAGALNLASATGTLGFNGAVGTAGQVALSAGAGAVPTWGTVDQTFCVYNTGALAGATAFGQTKFTHSATVDTSSTIAQDVAGTGAGNFVVKVCTDGATCAGGNTFLTYTEACTAAAGVITAATVQNSGAIPANSTVTVSVATACGPDPAANVCIHYTTP